MSMSLQFQISMSPAVHEEACIPAAPPKPPNGEPEAAGAAPVEAPPNSDGFAASPAFAAPPNAPPKLGVEDAPAVAPPPPNRPPVAGLLAAGVPDDPPPNRPAPPELAAPPPNSPELGVLDPAAAEPKRDGDEEPVVLLAPPKSPPAGLGAPEPALLPLGCPNVKPDMVAPRCVDWRTRRAGVWVWVVVGCWLLQVAVYSGANL